MLGKKLLLFILIFQNYSCKTITTDHNVNNDTEIRYIETYGSICCPRDYKFDNHLVKYITTFENKHHVKLELNFKLSLGKEGEATYFLSLKNLSEKLQEDFVNQRLKSLKLNEKSATNHLKNPISIKEALELWEDKSISNLIEI